MKVFLGGTCNESTWRDELIPLLKIDYFNPVVDDWTPECMEEEIYQRNVCDFCLYVITPKMTGVYSIAEVVDDSNKRPEKTIFCFLEYDDGYFTEGQIKSLQSVAKMVVSNGGKSFTCLEDVATYLNGRHDIYGRELKGRCASTMEYINDTIEIFKSDKGPDNKVIDLRALIEGPY